MSAQVKQGPASRAALCRVDSDLGARASLAVYRLPELVQRIEFLLKDLESRRGCFRAHHQHSKSSVADRSAHLGTHFQEVRAVPGAATAPMREYHESRQHRQRSCRRPSKDRQYLDPVRSRAHTSLTHALMRLILNSIGARTAPETPKAGLTHLPPSSEGGTHTQADHERDERAYR